jgi:hypothetical protein
LLNVVIAVLLSLFLGPGMGQLYNREFKKGAYLIGVSLVVVLSAAVWCFKASQPYLPVDLTTVDPGSLQTMLRNAATQVAASNGQTLMTYQVLVLGMWIYSIIDAAVVAMRKAPVQTISKNP